MLAGLDFAGDKMSYLDRSMKQVVTKPSRYEPLFSEALQQWALHYNITLLATRPVKPKDKAAVENIVKIAYQRIYAPLRDQPFFHLSEINTAIMVQLEIHNQKLFQLKDHSRAQLYESQEKKLLQPLPPGTFVIKHKALAKVQKNYHITLGEKLSSLQRSLPVHWKESEYHL